MATYRIDISSDEQTITGATYDNCITGMTMDIATDPNQIVDSTGMTNGNFTAHCTSNGSNHSREYTYRLVYTHSGGVCEHNIHLVQAGSEDPSEEITLEYQINIPNYQGNGNLYLCTHTLQGNSHARELFRTGVALTLLTGQRFDVDTFVAIKTNGICRFKQVQTMGIVNDTSGGGVTVTNFSEDTPYYVVVVNNAEGQYSIFGTQANLKTREFNSAGDCSDYVQDIN